MTGLNEMTVEHLGAEATAEDLGAFKRAVRALMDDENWDEAEAVEHVWNDGEFARRVDAILYGADEPCCDDERHVNEDANAEWDRLYQASVDEEAHANLAEAHAAEVAEQATVRAFDREMGV